MEITKVGITNTVLETEDGTTDSPTTFYMNVAVDEVTELAIPISSQTHQALTELIEDQLQ